MSTLGVLVTAPLFEPLVAALNPSDHFSGVERFYCTGIIIKQRIERTFVHGKATQCRGIQFYRVLRKGRIGFQSFSQHIAVDADNSVFDAPLGKVRAWFHFSYPRRVIFARQRPMPRAWLFR